MSLPFDRSPFEHQIAGMLGTAAAAAVPPAGLAAALRSRVEAPWVVTAFAAVNTLTRRPR